MVRYKLKAAHKSSRWRYLFIAAFKDVGCSDLKEFGLSTYKVFVI